MRGSLDAPGRERVWRSSPPRGLVAAVAIALVVAATAGAQSFASLREAGVKLPPRWGVTFTLYSQRQDYDVSSLSFDFPGVDLSQVQGLAIDNKTETQHVQIDYWLLPYLNVFLLGGNVDGTTSVKLGDLELGLPIRLNDLRIKYSGTVYGGGATLAAGWNQHFASLTYEYTSTDLDITTTSVEAWVATLKVGHQAGDGAFWIGAMYQSVDERDSGVFEMPFLGSIPFDVKLQGKDPWNLVLGGIAGIGEHWTLTMEAGTIGRRSAMLSLGYRF